AAPGEGSQMSELSGLFVVKPESVTATKGKDITFVSKVDSSALTRKPVMKWVKGKWLDLSSKAGKHLQFKESYDRNTKVHIYYLCHNLCLHCFTSCYWSVNVTAGLFPGLKG
ncbi:hypothetical protein AMECASPLE_011184, partial [Ameca splendens]